MNIRKRANIYKEMLTRNYRNEVMQLCEWDNAIFVEYMDRKVRRIVEHNRKQIKKDENHIEGQITFNF